MKNGITKGTQKFVCEVRADLQNFNDKKQLLYTHKEESKGVQPLDISIPICTCSLRYSVICDSKVSLAATVTDGVQELPSRKEALIATCFCA